MKKRLSRQILIVAALAAMPPVAAQRAPGPVPADYAPLKASLYMSLGDSIYKSTEMGSGDYPVFSAGLPREALAEHANMIALLKAEGVRMLDVRDLADEAVRKARDAGELKSWLEATFPGSAPLDDETVAAVDGRTVFADRDDHFYRRNADGGLDPVAPGFASMYWSRDFAISTPRGLIVGNGRRWSRARENRLARLIFRYADAFKDIPIAFDAAREGVFLDGGDVIVLDADTLLVGVDNRSSRAAAPKLARRLDMDVLAVAMPPWEQRSGLTRMLLHLDSTFNVIDDKTAVAVPFFLEKAWVGRNPMAPVLLGLADQMARVNEAEPATNPGSADAVRRTVELMDRVGWVTRYAAGTGEETQLELKLVDYMREKGYRVVPVGGEQGSLPLTKYAVERAMYELRWQGANVVQLGPGRVLAYRHNVHTNQALRDAGVEVVTFAGQLLSMRNGGPHCLLMPLVRGPLESASGR